MTDSVMTSATPEIQNKVASIDKETTTESLTSTQRENAIPPVADACTTIAESATDDKEMKLAPEKTVEGKDNSEKKTAHLQEMIIDLCGSEEEENTEECGMPTANIDGDSDDDSDMKISELKKVGRTAGTTIQNSKTSVPTKDGKEEIPSGDNGQLLSEIGAGGTQDGTGEKPTSKMGETKDNALSATMTSPYQASKENVTYNGAQPTTEESTVVKRDSNVLGSPEEMKPAAKKQKSEVSVVQGEPVAESESKTQQKSGLDPLPMPTRTQASEQGENPSPEQMNDSASVADPKGNSQSAKSEKEPSAEPTSQLAATSQPDVQPTSQSSVQAISASVTSPSEKDSKPETKPASIPNPDPKIASSPGNIPQASMNSTPSSLSVGSSEVIPASTPGKVPGNLKTVGARVISESIETGDVSAASSPILPTSSSNIVESTNATNTPKPSSVMSSASAATASPGKNNKDEVPICDPTFASLVKLDPIESYSPLPLLSARDIAELESSLQIGARFNNGPDDGWRDDWSGNIQLIDKELILNRDKLAQNPQAKPITMPFSEYVSKNAKNSDGLRGLNLLLSYVYHMKGTPLMAKRIMANALQRPAKGVDQRLSFIVNAVKRISYDPTVLRQDGWTTVKSDSPQGASGGAFLIGQRVIWHRFEAIIIAFVHDDEIGDLWKAMWLEDHETFDLEADELQEAMRKWSNKQKKKQEKALSSKMAKPLSGGSIHKTQGTVPKPVKPTASSRFAASTNFTVEGIEHGIILATSFHQNARIGVVWPARVMHVSEIKTLGGSQQASRRSSSKNNIHVVFLAPYWNGHYSFSSKNRSDLFVKNPNAGKDAFSAGPLFEMETVEVSETTIQKYPYDGSNSDALSIDNLRSAFRFLGLPKAAFPRFLDSHRLAMSLKNYARKEILKTRGSSSNDASHASAFAALTDTHTLSVRTAMFPNAILNLPFDYMLSKLPPSTEQVAQLGNDDLAGVAEPVIQLDLVIKTMTPPYCWGKNVENSTSSPSKVAGVCATPDSHRRLTPINSPTPKFSSAMAKASGSGDKVDDEADWVLSNFASEYLLDNIGKGSDGKAPITALASLGNELVALLSRFRCDLAAADKFSAKEREKKLEAFLCRCLVIKGYGEDLLSLDDIPEYINQRNMTIEWRKACERIFKRATAKFSTSGFGNGVTVVLTDSRCNQHLTATGSFERAVRLPAAIRGAKQAGAGSKEGMRLMTKVDDKYMELAEKKILPKAHKASYLKRMKTKIAALPPDAKGAPLTDDSEGEGGEDTMGSRGSYTAAVAGVAAALQAVNMVVGGKCVNVFCAVRPPGHHAGRDLRPMNAISNGFCLLNAAACAALYATAPQSEGGLGLKRVCVIDFDVHHGNGTQDILCSTHDSRFLYVSLHAGGAHINGYEEEGNDSENDDGLRRSLPGGGRNEGIFPGRCGDTSPHEGVLNIPLGQKVTAQAIGNALVSQVSPAVESFSPELIILSAGFDAHKHDPLGMGGLSAEDFGSVTDVACQMAFKTCSGRVLSILEGGYGVPCCRIKKDLFLPNNAATNGDITEHAGAASKKIAPFKVLELGDDLPKSMEDDVPIPLQQKLDKCHAEGFLECIKEHVSSLARCNCRVDAK